jgi:spore coat protein U-like protein
MIKSKLLALAVASGLLAAGAAMALPNPVTATFQVSATVLKACTVSATALAFGNYTPGSGAITNTSAINVACTKGTPFTMSVNGGSTTGGSISQRLMTNGTQTLQYNLYTSNALTTLLGDGTTGANVTGTGAGLATASTTTVFGQLPDSAANQAVPPGSYTDTVTVSVAY